MKNTHRLNLIFEKTDGCCHLCHKKLSFGNYGQRGAKGAWEIEHSRPKSKGGTNHLNNLFPACIQCNFEKGVALTRSVRERNGLSRAPYSKQKKEEVKTWNTIGGVILGGLVGAILGPGGVIIGASLGGVLGNESSPKK